MFLELESVKCGASKSKLLCSFCLLYKVLDVLLLDIGKEKIDTKHLWVTMSFYLPRCYFGLPFIYIHIMMKLKIFDERFNSCILLVKHSEERVYELLT